MSKVNVYGSFVQALFFSATVGVPKYFLNHYSELEISHIEALLIIQIMSELENTPYPSTQMLAKRMNLETSQVEEMITHLMTLNYLSIEKRWNSEERKSYSSYSLIGLIDELADRWAIEQVKHFEDEQKQQKERVEYSQSNNPTMERIIKTFEQELARPLTSIECEIINNWISSKFSEELILEAFKRGVMVGIRNFRYLDSILREWEKKGLRTLAEIETDDTYFQSRQEKSSRSRNTGQNRTPRKPPTNKYENFYL
ncbi:DNA replication protein DnaD [Sporomusaceae bacterium FL31]|nr:DNA replication protein DnaD [Sporomusaceae bacterium FL31]